MEIKQSIKFGWNPLIRVSVEFNRFSSPEVKTMKYTEEVKAEAVKAAKSGMTLKAIQSTIGPNPKATQRYLAKEGVDYKALRAKLIKEGKLVVGSKKNPAATPAKK